MVFHWYSDMTGKHTLAIGDSFFGPVLPTLREQHPARYDAYVKKIQNKMK